MDEMSGISSSLRSHEAEEMRLLNKLSESIKETKGTIMETPVIENIFKPGTTGAVQDGLGLGMGGGALGLVALLALLSGNRNGLGFGGANGDGGSAVNQITLGQIQTALGDIKAAVPYNEAQVQLALAQQVASLTGQLNTSTQNTLAASADVRRDIAGANAVNIAGFGTLERAVSAGTYATATAVRDDGDKTRALITSQNEANLQRMLTVAENALLEQRAISRSREVEVNVTQNVNQNQAQLQTQAQQQQQFLITNNLLQQILSQAQIAQATNQSLIIGNTGGVASGAQTANPVNVRA